MRRRGKFRQRRPQQNHRWAGRHSDPDEREVNRDYFVFRWARVADNATRASFLRSICSRWSLPNSFQLRKRKSRTALRVHLKISPPLSIGNPGKCLPRTDAGVDRRFAAALKQISQATQRERTGLPLWHGAGWPAFAESTERVVLRNVQLFYHRELTYAQYLRYFRASRGRTRSLCNNRAGLRPSPAHVGVRS